MQKLFLKTPVGFRLSVKLKKWLERVKKKKKKSWICDEN